MRSSLAATMAATALTLSVTVATPVFAADGAAEPSVHQIYEAAEAGHFDQAQQMMDQVLKDHPQSGKAHYVQAELFAKEGKTPQARAELTQAEQYDPGLTHENPRSVQELKAQLGLAARSVASPHLMGVAEPPAAHFPWGMVLIFALVIGGLWMLFRRRSAYGQYPVAGGGAPGNYGPGGYGSPGYGPGYGGGAMGGGGLGSGIVGGLASGLAVGAGVVAGEEVAHHFLDGNSHESGGGIIPPASAGDWQPTNTDMGGSDFGVNDAGSWGDSGGGGGGGDDWS